MWKCVCYRMQSYILTKNAFYFKLNMHAWVSTAASGHILYDRPGTNTIVPRSIESPSTVHVFVVYACTVHWLLINLFLSVGIAGFALRITTTLEWILFWYDSTKIKKQNKDKICTMPQHAASEHAVGMARARNEQAGRVTSRPMMPSDAAFCVFLVYA